ncbi:MAG: S-methyl-5'-thioadenosine phosphorylase, partial [Candidatus Melainabacteria bacterium]|nr:S-methyl-5'-thioadenosine phosphorylase [Candidatus Melainabacteria bacterium]
VKVFGENITKLQALLVNLIGEIKPERKGCQCAETLSHARI